jgi:hypothetical protein
MIHAADPGHRVEQASTDTGSQDGGNNGRLPAGVNPADDERDISEGS